MPTITRTIEVEVEITYTTDKDIRQGSDARYPSELVVDDYSWEFKDKDATEYSILKKALDHLYEGE